MKRLKDVAWSILAVTLFAFTLIPVQNAQAQWAIGASYEMRDLEPTNGFGLRIQRGILQGLPVVDLGIRAHFSYFSETVDSYRDVPTSTSVDLDSYDFGLAGYGGVNLGLLKPYAGVGLGSESFEAVQSGAQNDFEFEDNSIYWNLFIGAEISPIPVLKPFIEYRFTRLFADDGFDYRQNGRLAIGLTINF
jgi:opacity protein-like surface antigen